MHQHQPLPLGLSINLRNPLKMNQILLWIVLLSLCNSAQALTTAQVDQARATLLARYQSASSEISNNAFGIPLVLNSSVKGNRLDGQIIGVLDDDYSDAIRQFDTPEDWCDILMLHVNTKACTFENADSSTAKLHLYSGRKFYQTPEQATKLSLDYSTIAQRDDYFSVKLFSDDGPLGTSDYLIALEVMPLPDEATPQTPAHNTLIRMTFSYQMSWFSRQTVRLYLATLARHKVGFTVLGMQNNKPVYIKGLQGIIERNTIRYYLAIKTKLDAADANQDPLHLYRKWFDATQRYKRQLYEVDKHEYLQNKARELENQRQLQAIIGPTTDQ